MTRKLHDFGQFEIGSAKRTSGDRFCETEYIRQSCGMWSRDVSNARVSRRELKNDKVLQSIESEIGL
jgi:hypothetical protein